MTTEDTEMIAKITNNIERIHNRIDLGINRIGWALTLILVSLWILLWPW